MSAKIQVMASLLRNSSGVTNFCYSCVEYIKLDTFTKFHDHQSNNDKVMIGALMPPSPND